MLHLCPLPPKALLSQIWSRSGQFADSSGNGRVVTPPQRDKPLLTPVWQGVLDNLNSQTTKWGPRKGEWPLWGEEEHGYRRNFPDEGKWSGVPVAPTTGQAERPAVRLPHPLPLKGRTGQKPRPASLHFPNFFGRKKVGSKIKQEKGPASCRLPGVQCQAVPAAFLRTFQTILPVIRTFPANSDRRQ